MVVAVPPRVMKMKYFEDPYKYRMIVSLVGVIPGAVSIILIGYFYILVYLGVRKRNVAAITEVRSLITAKRAAKVAKTTAIRTDGCCVYLVYSVGNLPVLRTSLSRISWKFVFSLVDDAGSPQLCLQPGSSLLQRSARYREALQEILKIRKPAPNVKRKVRRNDNIKSLGDPQEKDRKPRLRSCGSIQDLPNTDDKRTKGKVGRERRFSAPSCETSKVVCVDANQPESMRTKPERQVKGTRHRIRYRNDKIKVFG